MNHGATTNAEALHLKNSEEIEEKEKLNKVLFMLLEKVRQEPIPLPRLKLILTALFNAGADVNARDKDGYTCLTSALAFGKYDIAQALITEFQANVNIATLSGYAPLHFAIGHWRVHKGMLPTLIAAGAQVDEKYKNGRTPLHQAIVDEIPDVRELIRVLIAAGASVNTLDDQGRSPIQDAYERGQHDIVEILKEQGDKENDLNSALPDNKDDGMPYAFNFAPTPDTKALLALQQSQQLQYQQMQHQKRQKQLQWQQQMEWLQEQESSCRRRAYR